MALTVDSAFLEFNRDFVNLDPERTKIARSSSAWLIDQFQSLSRNDEQAFPLTYPARHNKFGSFSRNVKIRELDDIDLICCLHANNAFYKQDFSKSNSYMIMTPNAGQKLKDLSDESVLNSRKVINALVSGFSSVEQYKKADIHRQEEAATLQLNSYEWNFDVVPAFHTTSNFYLIPDGHGAWKATNPAVDQARITSLNSRFPGKVFQLVRILKYWNRRSASPRVTSYLFENFVLDFVETQSELTDFVEVNVLRFFNYFQSAIFLPVNDPSKISGDLNKLSHLERLALSRQAKDVYEKGLEANNLEVHLHNQQAAMNRWRDIFGPSFPAFG